MDLQHALHHAIFFHKLMQQRHARMPHHQNQQRPGKRHMQLAKRNHPANGVAFFAASNQLNAERVKAVATTQLQKGVGKAATFRSATARQLR